MTLELLQWAVSTEIFRPRRLELPVHMLQISH